MNVILELLLRAVRFVIDKISDVIYFILYEESESWMSGLFFTFFKPTNRFRLLQVVYRDFSYTRLPALPDYELEREILTSSASHLIEMLKEGRVSSVKIVDTFIQRIEQVEKFDIGPEMCGYTTISPCLRSTP